MIKKIIHRPKRPLFTFKKEDISLYGPRVKSAPPIEINFDLPARSESKPTIRFIKADGTPLTEKDLEDSNDSDSSSTVSKDASTPSEKEEPESRDILFDLKVSKMTSEMVESEEEIEAKDREVMLDDLIRRFSEQRLLDRKLCYNVDEMLRVEERTKIPLDLKIRKKKEETKSSYKTDRNRKDTCVEQARLEFNRLAAKNLGLVIKNLKNVKVGTIAEMKEIARILFNKATSEPTFVKHYALLVLDLRKEWQSEEEKAKDVSQTVFFGMLLTLTLRTLENREKWGDELEKKGEMSFEERVVYEEELEEAETERYTKKRRTLGTIDFLSALYSLNVISFVHVNACIGALMASDDSESVEVLCYLVESIGEKLVVSGKEHVISNVCSNLMTKKSNHANRIKYMIEGLMQKKSMWKSGDSSKARNMFSCLEIENDQVALQDKATESMGNESILTFLSSLFEELSIAYDEEDRQVLTDNFCTGESKFGVNSFYYAYFQEAVSNYKTSEVFIDFFISFRKAAKISEEQLKDVLCALKNDLDILRIDFPISPKKYAELITRLRVAGIVSPTVFDQLKTAEHDMKIVDLVSKWYRSEDDREKALLVFPREKIENLAKK